MHGARPSPGRLLYSVTWGRPNAGTLTFCRESAAWAAVAGDGHVRQVGPSLGLVDLHCGQRLRTHRAAVGEAPRTDPRYGARSPACTVLGQEERLADRRSAAAGSRSPPAPRRWPARSSRTSPRKQSVTCRSVCRRTSACAAELGRLATRRSRAPTSGGRSQATNRRAMGSLHGAAHVPIASRSRCSAAVTGPAAHRLAAAAEERGAGTSSARGPAQAM